MWVRTAQYSVSRIIKTKQIDATTDTNGYLKTGLNEKQIPIGIGGLSDARYAFHTGNEADNGRTIRLMAWDGSVGRFSNKYVNVLVYYVEVQSSSIPYHMCQKYMFAHLQNALQMIL